MNEYTRELPAKPEEHHDVRFTLNTLHSTLFSNCISRSDSCKKYNSD